MAKRDYNSYNSKEGNLMKNVFIAIGVGFVFMVFGFFIVYGFNVVEPGNVGIKINLYGENKGVQSYTLRTGAVWYNRFTERVYEFPTYMQNANWSAGNYNNEEITFNSSEGAVMRADVSLSYQIKPEKVPEIFTELRQDAEYITHVFMRAKTRDAISRIASKYTATEIYGEKKTAVMEEVGKELIRELEHKGFVIDMVSFVGEMRVEQSVKESINATITATQRAIEAQNKVLQSKAEADQKIEDARGEAESIIKVATAKAEANKMLTESLSPALLNYEALQRWDGILPKVTSSAIPMISLDVDKVDK